MGELGILCAGQGRQSQHMFSKLEDSPLLSHLLQVLSLQTGQPFTADLDGQEEGIFSNEIAQPLIVGQTYLCWQALKALLPRPLLFVGYSVGELSAYACAESFDLDTALYLARQRALLMNRANRVSGGMLSIKGLSKSAIETLCKDSQCYIAIENGLAHYIVGGEEAALARFLESASRTPHFEKAMRLQVSVPSHTPLLLSAVKPFTRLLQECNIQDPSIPVLAGMNAHWVAEKAEIIETLPAQIAQTIYFEKVLRTAVEQGVSVFLEIGPGHALAGMVHALSLPVEVKSLDDFASIAGAAQWTAARLQN